MKKKFFIPLLTLFSLLIPAVTFLGFPVDYSIVNSQQMPYLFVLNSSNFDFLPSSSGSGQSDLSNSPKTKNGNSIIFAYGATFKSGSRIRMVKNSGYLANVTPLTGLKAITIDIPSGRANLSYGASYGNYSANIEISNGMRYDIDSMPYFKISAGSSTPYINSISIEYLCDSSGELDPVKPHVHNGYHYLAKEPTITEPGNLEFYACSECAYVSLVKEDEGTYIDTILTHPLSPDHIAYLPPTMLAKPAQFTHPIAINLKLPSDDYPLDQTGASDASSTIQSALNYVSSLGGGTVFISSGKYLLSNQLVIPSRVTLVGDFKGPSSDDYGTVLFCTKTHNGLDHTYSNAQIIVNSNSGINGFTFFYPNQNINDVVRYGYTIYAYQDATADISNLLFINSYDGITVSDLAGWGGELVNIDNIYGTFLHSGITGYYQSDAGSWNNINISPSFYENALTEYRCSDVAALYKYARSNLVAMTLGDLDDFSFDRINIDNANIGIYFPTEVNEMRPLQAFWGLFNNVNIEDCSIGVYATRLFSGCGVVFTHSSLGKVINVSDTGVMKLSKCQYDELLGTGNTMIECGSENYSVAPSFDDSHSFSIPDKVYYIDNLDDTGVTDVSYSLQTEINKCQNGGVIIIKNGTYRLDNPITIPNNTMLTSFANSFYRTANSENKNDLVKFISYSDDACVKLGSYSGINGIRIYNVYKDPDMAYDTLSNGQSDSYVAVKAIGDNCFAINSEVSYTFTGFDFSNSSNHYIKHCYGSAYETFIKAGGSGKIIGSLSNLSFLARNCLYSFAQDNVETLQKYFNFEDDSKEEAHDKAREITRTYSTMIKISGGTELVHSSFSYGIKTLINSINANLLAINTSQDNLKDDNYMYIINGGDAKIVGSLRVFGNSFNLISGHIEIYGRLEFVNRREKYYNSSTSTDDDPEPITHNLIESVLTNCEYSLSGVTGAGRNSSIKKQGSYSWRGSSTSNPAIAYTFTARDISLFMRHGYLRFYVYVTNIASRGSEYYVELTSSGKCDNDEISCQFDDQITATGWNEIYIKLSDMTARIGNFNPSAVNYFRFYTNGSSCYHYLDYVSFFHEPITDSPLIINECETLDHSAAVSTSNFRMEGSYSWASTSADGSSFVYYQFSAINISSYMSTGYISFYLYVPDCDLLGNNVIVELSSSGIWDDQEIYCNAIGYITEDGWNHVKIPLSTFISGSETTFSPSACNFFRLYMDNSAGNFYLDDIRLVK